MPVNWWKLGAAARNAHSTAESGMRGPCVSHFGAVPTASTLLSWWLGAVAHPWSELIIAQCRAGATENRRQKIVTILHGRHTYRPLLQVLWIWCCSHFHAIQEGSVNQSQTEKALHQQCQSIIAPTATGENFSEVCLSSPLNSFVKIIRLWRMIRLQQTWLEYKLFHKEGLWSLALLTDFIQSCVDFQRYDLSVHSVISFCITECITKDYCQPKFIVKIWWNHIDLF